MFTEHKCTCTYTVHKRPCAYSHKATPKSSEEEVRCPDQRNLVITGKSVSLNKNKEAFLGLGNPKQNRGSTCWESHWKGWNTDTHTNYINKTFPPPSSHILSYRQHRAPMQRFISIFTWSKVIKIWVSSQKCNMKKTQLPCILRTINNNLCGHVYLRGAKRITCQIILLLLSI